MEYKFIAVSQIWSTDGMLDKVNAKANELAKEGWVLSKMEKGFSGFFFATLYLAFERKI
jgi:hypothetical protein